VPLCVKFRRLFELDIIQGEIFVDMFALDLGEVGETSKWRTNLWSWEE